MNHRTIIDIKDLIKNYSGTPVLKGIQKKITTGKVIGIIGPNGAGKTTFLRILATLLKPTGGELLIDGMNPRSDLFAVRQLIELCPDRLPIDGNINGKDFLEFFAGLHKKGREKIDAILDMVGLTEVAHRPIKNYSRGMVKRISIGRVLLIDPKIMLFDEPTSGLDPKGQRKIQDILLSMDKENKSIIISSHDLYEIERICDEIIQLKNGRFSVLESVSEAFDEDDSIIIDLRMEGLKDDFIESVLREFPDLVLLSKAKRRIRFRCCSEIRRDDFMRFLTEEGGMIEEIKFM